MIIFIVLLVLYILNIVWQIKFEFPILQKRQKDEQENMDEEHASNGTIGSGPRIYNDKILKIKHKKELFTFWLFSIAIPIHFLERIIKLGK